MLGGCIGFEAMHNRHKPASLALVFLFGAAVRLQIGAESASACARLALGHESLERARDLTHLPRRSCDWGHVRRGGQGMGQYGDLTDSANLIRIIQQVQPVAARFLRSS